MSMKIEQKVEAEFIDEWKEGFGWIARPEEDMKRTSNAFVDEVVYLLDSVLGLKYLNKSGKSEVKIFLICSSFYQHFVPLNSYLTLPGLVDMLIPLP